MYVGGEWLSYIVLGLVIWLGSDLWLYAMSLYRAGPWKQLPRHTHAQLRLRVFWVERVHRLVAYVLPWVLAGFHLSDFALLVLGTGLANDVLDATFQWKSLSKRGAKTRRQPTYSRRHALEPSLLAQPVSRARVASRANAPILAEPLETARAAHAQS